MTVHEKIVHLTPLLVKRPNNTTFHWGPRSVGLDCVLICGGANANHTAALIGAYINM
jgi:hypothetical protein